MITLLAKWNPNPATEKVTSYKVFEHVSGSYVLRQITAQTSVKLSVRRNTTHYYAVSATNAYGQGPRCADVRIKV
jgi:hypothetical protein